MPISLAQEIIYGSVEGVAHLLQLGVDVNEVDEYGYTPLIETAIANKVEIAELLLQHGANIKGIDMTGRTALHWAVDNHNMPLCELLLKHHADANAYSAAGQPVLTYPLLRNQTDLKSLLYSYGADLDFTQDYINTKLVGHRYELAGEVYVVDAEGRFILIDLEGFFFEFTIGILDNSLKRYLKNFAARHQHDYFNKLQIMINALEVAAELIKYQQYTVNIYDHSKHINDLLDNDMIVIPVAYEGHAITFIQYGDYVVKCDRGANSKIEGTVVIYRINKPRSLTKNFIKDLIYKKHDREFVNRGINKHLGLMRVGNIPLPAQISGNCSWANVEASIPAMMFLLLLSEHEFADAEEINAMLSRSMHFYEDWHEWDKDRAIEECINSFAYANAARKATKASLLGAVMFQSFSYHNPKDVARAEKILPVLSDSKFEYILRTYLKHYCIETKTERGTNLKHLLDMVAPRRFD